MPARTPPQALHHISFRRSLRSWFERQGQQSIAVADHELIHGIPLLPFRLILYLILYRIATVVALQVAAKALGILKSAAGVLCSDSSLPP